MWRRRLGLIIVNAAMFVLLAEVAAVAIYYAANGRLFYTHRKAYPLIAETAQGRLTADALHPYFGPIHKPGVRPETNNIGFGSPHPFPFIRTSNRRLGGATVLRSRSAASDRDIETTSGVHGPRHHPALFQP
jgi:hypothetical protein